MRSCCLQPTFTEQGDGNTVMVINIPGMNTDHQLPCTRLNWPLFSMLPQLGVAGPSPNPR